MEMFPEVLLLTSIPCVTMALFISCISHDAVPIMQPQRQVEAVLILFKMWAYGGTYIYIYKSSHISC